MKIINIQYRKRFAVYSSITEAKTEGSTKVATRLIKEATLGSTYVNNHFYCSRDCKEILANTHTNPYPLTIFRAPCYLKMICYTVLNKTSFISYLLLQQAKINIY